MNKQRKTSHILNVFQYDADGHVILPASLTLSIAPTGEDNSGKVPTTAWVRSVVGGAVTAYTPTSRTITINGTSYDLSSNRSWSIDTGVLTASAGSGISVSVVSQNLNIVNTGLLTATSGSGISVSTVNQNLNIVNTGLLTATAGAGISVSTVSQNLNIVNTGLLTATAGSGITVSVVNQNLNVVNTGILTASAGSGISLSVVGQNLNVVNTGVLTATAGAGISLSVVNGNLNVVNTITNNNQLTNGAGFITGYTETDTLATVTGRGATTLTVVTFSGGDGNNSSVKLAGYNQRGGSGYHGFLETTNTFGSATNASKYFRLDSVGTLQIVNNAYTATILSLTDAGALSVPSLVTAGSFVRSGGTSTQFLKADGSVDSSTYATQTYVTTQISNLVNSAPATLDTLNELAAALGNDANFSTTVTNSIATRVPQTRTLTINGTAYDLSADRSWTITAGVSSVNAGTGVSVNSTTGAVTVSIGQSVATSAQVTFDSVITNNNGNGTNFRIGDDVWIGDINAANTFRIQGVQNAANAYIVFGNGDTTALGRAGTGALTYGGNTIYHAGNLTNLNQLTNGPGYITGYSETDTLSSVVSRGSSTSIGITINPNGTSITMGGSASAEGIRMQASTSTTYPVFLRSVNPSGGGETSAWIFKEADASWGIWHNNPINTLDITRASTTGIENNVGGGTNTVMIRLSHADGSGQFTGNILNRVGTTILDQSGNIPGTAGSETLSTVTGRGASTSSPITISSGGSQPLSLTTSSGSPWHLALNRTDLGLTSRVFAHNAPYNGWYFEHNISIAGNTNWHSGNLTNLNQLTNGPGYITAESDTLASVTGRGASTSTFSNFNGGLNSAKTSKTAYGIQIKGGFYGAPRLQLYDLALDGNAYVGLGVDMSGAAYEFSNYFPRYAGYGRWSVGSWAGDFGSGQYISGYNEKLWINESAAAFNVPLTVNGRITTTSSLGLYVNSGGASYIGINSTSSWAYTSLLNNGSTTWDLGAFNGGNFEFRPYGGDSNRIIVGLNGVMYFTDTTNGIYKSGGRLTVRSESTDNVANFANYGLYLPQTGQTAGLYVESPIEARTGIRMGSGAGNGTITVGADTGAGANRLVQRDAGGDTYVRYSFAVHFNASCPNNENPSIAAIWTNSGTDNYLRKSSPGHLISQLGLVTGGPYLPISGGSMTGNISLRYSTANGDDYSALSFAPGSNDYIIKASTTRGVFGRSSFGWHVDTTSAFGVYSNGWVKLFGVEGGSGNTQVFGNLSVVSGIDQNNLVGRPYAVWGASGGASGPVVIKFPGGTGNYGMIHAVIDIYEYSGNHAATVIVGGHNWNGAWYNFGAQVIGFTDKPVRVGVKDGKYCIVIGNGSSGWSYGQVVLRKIQNGTYYQNVMSVSSGYTAAIESDSYSWISGDLRNLSTPSSFYAGGTITSANNVSISSTSSEPIIITGAMHKYITINPGNGWEAMVRYIGGSGSGWYVGKRITGQLIGTESFHFYSEAAGATVAGITTGGVLHTSNGAVLNGQVNINRHIDANTTWGSCTSIFVGWSSGKVILGNGNSGGHDYALNLGCNTVVSVNPFFCFQDITAFSDARVKDNVEVIENAVEKVKSIRGVTFTRNDTDDTTKRHAGVIAQEILEVLPEIVSEDERGHYSVAYGNLTSLLIEAIKEQQKQIEELQNKVNSLIQN